MNPSVAVLWGAASIGPLDLLRAIKSERLRLLVVAVDPLSTSEDLSWVHEGDVIRTALDGSVPKLLEWLRHERGLSGITTFTDQLLPLASQLSSNLGLPGLSREVSDLLGDKLSQRVALNSVAQQKREACRIIDVGEVPSFDRYPAILKPAVGRASRFTVAVDSREMLLRALSRLPAPQTLPSGYVLEELIPAALTAPLEPLVSVESVSTSAGCIHHGVTLKFPKAMPLRETGDLVAPVSREIETAAFRVTSAALQACGINHGVTHTELIRTPSGFEVVEVNPRVGGYLTSLYRRSKGVDLVQEALRVAIGRAPSRPMLEASKIAWQYQPLAPLCARAVRGIRIDGGPRTGVRFARTVKSGYEFKSDFSTQPLGLLHGRSVDLPAVYADLSVALKGLYFNLDCTSGLREFSGLELPSFEAMGGAERWLTCSLLASAPNRT